MLQRCHFPPCRRAATLRQSRLPTTSNGMESCSTRSSYFTRAKVCLAVVRHRSYTDRTSERLGTVYLAEPICDDIRTTLPLELYVILFDSEHYVTTQGTILPLHQTRFLSWVNREEKTQAS